MHEHVCAGLGFGSCAVSYCRSQLKIKLKTPLLCINGFQITFKKWMKISLKGTFSSEILGRFFWLKKAGERSVDWAPYSNSTLIFPHESLFPIIYCYSLNSPPSIASCFWTLSPPADEVFCQAGEALGVRPHLEEVGHLGDGCLEDDTSASFLSHPCFLSAPCSQQRGLSNFCCPTSLLWWAWAFSLDPSCCFCLVVGHTHVKSLAVSLATFWKLPLYKVACWSCWILHL